MFANKFQNRAAPVSAFQLESCATSEPAEPRYPKRKRAEVHYICEDAGDTDDDSELEYGPPKRARHTKSPLEHKIFPFMSLPAELRNRIYEKCLPSPTEMPAWYDGNREGIWLCSKRRFYRKSVAYIPSAEHLELCLMQYGSGFCARARRRAARFDRGGNDRDNLESEGKGSAAGPKSLGLNILSVCKQTYYEAAPMMYGQPLVFTDLDALFAFAAKLSPRTAKLLRSIEIRCWTPTRSGKSRGYSAISMLGAKGVTNLTRLFINCSMGWFENRGWYRSKREQAPTPKKVARKVYRDCHLWLEVMGSTHGDLYKGVEVLQLSGDTFSMELLWEDVREEDKKMYKKELRRLLREGAC